MLLLLHPASVPAMAQREAPEGIGLPILVEFAQCVARRRTAAAHAVLALDPGTDEYRQALRGLARRTSVCAPNGRLRFGGILFAGAVAESLLPQLLNGGDLASRTAYDPSRPSLAARDETEYMAICLVRAAPADIAALLATGAASPEEAQAVRLLAPRMPGCVAGGATARINRPALRAVLALAAYRLIQHNAAPPQHSGS